MRKRAFRAITRLHDLKGRKERALRYLVGGYDAESNTVAITEQLGGSFGHPRVRQCRPPYAAQALLQIISRARVRGASAQAAA